MTETDQDDLKRRIVAFAAQVGSSENSAEDKARNRGWLDADGAPTEEGEKMLKDVGDQQGTRSVFR